MTAFADVPVLEGRIARLEPLGPEHAEDLARAVASGELWRKWAARIPAPDEIAGDIRRRRARRRGWAGAVGGLPRRDTVVSSILTAEWPAVRSGLQERVSAVRPE